MNYVESGPQHAGNQHADDGSSSHLAPWWGRGSAMLLFMLISTIPLWFTSLPPLIDFIGHVGRYRVALDIGTSPYLSQNWDYHWSLIGNLGVDILIIPLARLLGLEPAAWIVAAMLPPLMIWGIFRATKAIYGQVPASAVVALPFVLAYPYQYGFVNYWLSAGLAFHALATWVRMEGSPRLRAAIFVPISFVIWLCHVYGWGTFGILVGGYELSRQYRSGNWRILNSPFQAAFRTWPLLLILPVMLPWRANGEGSVTLGWFEMLWKLNAATFTLRDQWLPLDLASLGAAVLLIYASVRSRRMSFDSRFGMAAFLFTVALIVIPYQLFGSAFADARVYPFLFIAAILAIRIHPGKDGASLANKIALAATLVFILRVGVSAYGYMQYDAAYKRHLVALDHVERGASVAIMVRTSCSPSWRRPRLEHLGSMALVRREAFVNSQWDVPGAELLRARRATGTGFNTDPSQFVGDRKCPADLRPELGRRIARFPRQYYQYLWVFDFDPATLPTYPGLVKLYSDDRTILYRVVK